jgi:hypothetical protein
MDTLTANDRRGRLFSAFPAERLVCTPLPPASPPTIRNNLIKASAAGHRLKTKKTFKITLPVKNHAFTNCPDYNREVSGTLAPLNKIKTIAAA